MSNICVPKFHEIPNPNPKSDAITQPSSSNKLQKRKNNNELNWLELPEDLWFLIFSKLYTSDIIENVQKVCKLFRKICILPSMFRIINMLLPDAEMDLTFDVNVMTRYAIDRSAGELVDIYLEYCDDETLMYIVGRSKNLKHLRIGHHIHISDDVLMEAVRKLPVLEEVEIIICDFSEETFEAIGQACPSLKSFSLNDVGSRRRRFISNEEAFAIAKSMPNLRHLQLIGNCLTNEGLKAILDGCPLLESLDLRACFNIDLSRALGKRCDKIKQLRRPNDSTADYSHQACTDGDDISDTSSEEEQEYDYDYDSVECGMSDIFPGYLDYVHLDIYPDYVDSFDDFPYYDCCDCGFPGCGSSDSD